MNDQVYPQVNLKQQNTTTFNLRLINNNNKSTTKIGINSNEMLTLSHVSSFSLAMSSSAHYYDEIKMPLHQLIAGHECL